MNEKENMTRKVKIEDEKIIFSQENAAENSFKKDTRFALIPCYETWHPWKE
jgi:hypothetical protein